MTDQETYFQKARALMVETQIRPNDIVEPSLIGALRTLRREAFLPEPLRASAYIDADICLPNGRVMLAPLTIARLIHAASVRPGDRVLVVGAGTGYGAAVLARCGAAVTALESDSELRSVAKAAFLSESVDVRFIDGPLSAGDPEGAPYDLVLIEGKVDVIPTSFAAQISPRGRVVTILAERGVGRIVVAEALSAGRFAYRFVADANTGWLPGFVKASEFVF